MDIAQAGSATGERRPSRVLSEPIGVMKNVLRLLVAATALAVGLAACDNGDLPPAAQFSSLTGTVVDGTTHQPIAGATVIVDTVLTTTTDDKGNFSFDKVPSGIVDYVITAKGYADLSASANSEPGKPLALNLTMQVPAVSSP